MRVRHLVLAVVATALGAGCGPAPGEPRVPAGAVRVVPASQVRVVCAGDDDDDELAVEEAPPRRAIEYVKLSDWQPSAQVVEVEAAVPPRGTQPPSFTTYPKLTLHRSIDESSVRFGRRLSSY